MIRITATSLGTVLFVGYHGPGDGHCLVCGTPVVGECTWMIIHHPEKMENVATICHTCTSRFCEKQMVVR